MIQNEKLRRLLSVPQLHSPKYWDADHIVYLSSESGSMQIWQLRISTGETERLTNFSERLSMMAVYPKAGQIFFSMDEGGDENFQIYLLEMGGGQCRRLTEDSGARHIFGAYHEEQRLFLYAANKRDRGCFDLWAQPLDGGEARLLLRNDDHYNWPASNALSPDGRYFLYNKLKGESDNALWMLDLETGRAGRVPGDQEISAETAPAWKADSSGFYLRSDRQGDFQSLAYVDLASAKMSFLEEFSWDLESISLSPKGDKMALLINRDGFSDLKIYQLTDGCREMNIIRPPKAVISAYSELSWHEDGDKLCMTLSGGSRPLHIYELDLKEDSFRRLGGMSLSADEQQELVEPLLRRFRSYDGLEVPYWLYLPRGSEAGTFPLVVDIHGGPEGQKLPDFNPLIQFLLSRGIAVAAPNVRGSTGYGKRYTHLDDHEKRLDSIRDIASLADDLLSSGVTEPGRMAVMGASYGGFMTLSCLARQPEIWACGVDTVGIYNLVTFLERTAAYRRLHRESEYGSLENQREMLFSVSPAAAIEGLSAPLMVIHGANDPRVPLYEAEQIVADLRRKGNEVEFICYPDEGHGLSKLRNKLDAYPRMAEFFGKHLKIGQADGESNKSNKFEESEKL